MTKQCNLKTGSDDHSSSCASEECVAQAEGNEGPDHQSSASAGSSTTGSSDHQKVECVAQAEGDEGPDQQSSASAGRSETGSFDHQNKVRGLRCTRRDLERKRSIGVAAGLNARPTRSSDDIAMASLPTSSPSADASQLEQQKSPPSLRFLRVEKRKRPTGEGGNSRSCPASEPSGTAADLGPDVSRLASTGSHGLRQSRRKRRPRVEPPVGAIAVGSLDYGFDDQDLGRRATNEDPEIVVPGAASDPPHMDAAVRSTLVEAARVDTEVSQRRISRAREVDLEDVQRRRYIKERKEIQCQIIGLGIVVAAAVISAVVLCIAYTNREGLQPNGSTAMPRTTNPTMSLSPTFVPSAVLEAFQENLSSYTIESLQDVLSPQSLALQWLASLENITNMEDWRRTQLFALATFYYAFDGTNWPYNLDTDWLDLEHGRTECDWHSNDFGRFNEGGFVEFHKQGNEICNPKGEYTTLAFDYVGFSKSDIVLPPEIELMTSLTTIRFYNCAINASLSEWIPSQLYQMTQLVELHLGSNSFTGTIPSSIGSLTNLEVLFLNRNALTGTIPDVLHSKMHSLGAVQFGNNHLSGPLPTELGSIGLGLINVADNQLSGSIPSQLGLLTNLDGLILADNSFTGSLPTELSEVTNMGWLSAGNNALTGTLVSEFGLFHRMQTLSLGVNYLQGSVPTQLGLMTGLVTLVLDDNMISGRIPSQLGLLSVRNNSDAPEYIPLHVWVHINSFKTLGLGRNAISESLPTELGLLSSLQTLRVNHNPALEGNLPSELGNCSLYDVDFSGTGLSGELPPELAVDALVFFNVSGSQISGELPPKLCHLNSSLGFDCSLLLCGCSCDCE